MDLKGSKQYESDEGVESVSSVQPMQTTTFAVANGLSEDFLGGIIPDPYGSTETYGFRGPFKANLVYGIVVSQDCVIRKEVLVCQIFVDMLYFYGF